MAALLPVLVQDAPMEQNTQAVPLNSSESIPSAQVCGPRPREDDEVTQSGSFVPDEDDVQSKKSGGFGDTVLETKLVEEYASAHTGNCFAPLGLLRPFGWRAELSEPLQLECQTGHASALQGSTAGFT